MLAVASDGVWGPRSQAAWEERCGRTWTTSTTTTPVPITRATTTTRPAPTTTRAQPAVRLQSGDVRLTVLSSSFEGQSYRGCSTSDQFVVLHVRGTNIGSSSITVDGEEDLFLVAGGRTFQPICYYSRELGVINPGLSFMVELIYAVPSAWSSKTRVTLSYSHGWFNATDERRLPTWGLTRTTRIADDRWGFAFGGGRFFFRVRAWGGVPVVEFMVCERSGLTVGRGGRFYEPVGCGGGDLMLDRPGAE